MKRELVSVGYRNFSAINAKNDKVKNNLIVRKEGQSDKEYYSILFKNVEKFDETIKLYCNNTPFNDLLLTSKLTCIRNILISENIISERISSNELYNAVKKISTEFNSYNHK